MPIYLDTLKIVDYLPLLVEKLSEFIIAIIKANNGEIGSTLKYAYQELYKAIYYLYRNNYYLDMIQGEDFISVKEEKINKTNEPLDSILALLLKNLLEDTRALNNSSEEIDIFECISDEFLLLLVLERKDVPENEYSKEDLFIKRKLYKQLLENYYLDEHQVKHCRHLIEEYKCRKITSIKDKIVNNESLPHEDNMTLQDKLIYLENYKADIESEIQRIKGSIAKG